MTDRGNPGGKDGAMPQDCGKTSGVDVPGWVPTAARNYLRHTHGGTSIRALARDCGCHASTILRQVRRFENRRDDILIDEALRKLGAQTAAGTVSDPAKQGDDMTLHFDPIENLPSESEIERQSLRVLRRLAENGALLAVAKEMEKAVVVRETADGRTIRTGVVERAVAEAMALKDWIASKGDGRIIRYRITQAGRAALKRLADASPQPETGFAEAQTPFGDQHRVWGERDVAEDGDDKPKRIRYNVAESPVAVLARRRDKDGQAFLNDDLVRAGERLREDFELAQMGPRVTQNWERFLTGGSRGAFGSGHGSGQGTGHGPAAARNRVLSALHDLGPGLGDVALRCCCFLEGLEVTEKRMGWSARSGKIVLRIALERLKRHYETESGGQSPLIA